MVSGAPPLSSTARGDNTPRLTQLLANHLGILVGVDVHCALGKRVVLALPAGLPVGQHVVEHEPVAIPDALGGQLAALDQTHHGRTTHPEKVGGLLGGQRHALRRDGHRLAGVQRSHHLP